MAVRPLRLIGANLLGVLDSAAAAAVSGWGADWGVAVAACACAPVARADSERLWRQGWRVGAAAVWVDWSAELAGEIERALFAPGGMHADGAGAAAVLAPAVAADAVDALLDCLATLALGSDARIACLPGEQPEQAGAPMSGALVLSVRFGTRELACLLNDAAVQAWATRAGVYPAPLPALAALDLREAAGALTLALPVKLGGVDVNLASLMTVAVGDVIRLDMSLDQPLQVHSPDGRPLFSAHLGRSGSQVAVELIACI